MRVCEPESEDSKMERVTEFVKEIENDKSGGCMFSTCLCVCERERENAGVRTGEE
jgi:hypothetical protein